MTEEGIGFNYLYVLMSQDFIILECTVKKKLQILLFKGFQDKDLTTRKKGSDDLERRIFSSSSDQHDSTVFHSTQKGILLRFVESVDLVNEKNRGLAGREYRSRTGLVNDFPYILYTGTYSRQGIELTAEGLRNNPGEGSLSYSGRAPQYEG